MMYLLFCFWSCPAQNLLSVNGQRSNCSASWLHILPLHFGYPIHWNHRLFLSTACSSSWQILTKTGYASRHPYNSSFPLRAVKVCWDGLLEDFFLYFFTYKITHDAWWVRLCHTHAPNSSLSTRWALTTCVSDFHPWEAARHWGRIISSPPTAPCLQDLCIWWNWWRQR